jgi:cbb3-type cytochrome oxidase subunit 3
MAVFIHYLDRWKVPRYLRIILYVILAVQSYGLLLLSMVGVADIWFNFRKMTRDEQANN